MYCRVYQFKGTDLFSTPDFVVRLDLWYNKIQNSVVHKKGHFSEYIISVGKMKQKDHAVWGNCSAKWLFPSHCQAAFLHINGRPGDLSGTHINLDAYRNRAGRRAGVGCCYQSELRWACLLGPLSLCTVEAPSYRQRSEDWSLLLEKSLKELQEPSHRFFLDYCTWF